MSLQEGVSNVVTLAPTSDQRVARSIFRIFSDCRMNINNFEKGVLEKKLCRMNIPKDGNIGFYRMSLITAFSLSTCCETNPTGTGTSGHDTNPFEQTKPLGVSTSYPNLNLF